MLRFGSVLARVSVVVVGLSLLTLQGLVRGQIDAHVEGGPDSRTVQADGAIDEIATPEVAATVVVGRVIGPDGAPAVGAVVVTSAGGQAVTDAEGAFSLEVEVPAGVESVRVTAVLGAGTGSLVASSQVGGLALWGTTSAGMLVLEQSAGCEPSWIPTFGPLPGILGVDEVVYALTAFDDGSGPALYAGGGFTSAGGVAANYIAKWDGTSWSALGSGMDGGVGITPDVAALAVFDDGSGPALYAGGYFTTAGGVAANNIAKWNGMSWSALGSGVGGAVGSLTVFDDGSGPALYAGGLVTLAGGVTVNGVAKWNGSNWSVLGSGMDWTVTALTVFDDGSGSALYAGGGFTTAGGVAAHFIAKWNGTSWSALGSEVGGTVISLTVFDDGSGPALYAGGGFTSAGGVAANYIAKWDGTTWSALGSGTNDLVSDLAVYDDGSGPALYAHGWFTTAGSVAANWIAKWNGSSWSALGAGLNGLVYAFTAYDDGSGPALYADTFLTGLSGTIIVKWNGTTWSGLDGGLDWLAGSVQALTVFDDGSGPALYAGGLFTFAGAEPANYIAKWDGASWSALSSGMNGGVHALAVFDDGSGAALYAGGNFSLAGGVLANRIAKWNGTSWSALGTGLSGTSGPVVYALTVFDDGSGPALYAGGSFATAGSVVPAIFIAEWDGSSWSALGSGMNEVVNALTVFDGGSGPELYAGGKFTTAGGVAASRIAKWNGTTWSKVGNGISGVHVDALTVFDDGSGPALYAGGFFNHASGVAANSIAKWNGSIWSALGSGMGGGTFETSVRALACFDDGSGPALYAGGLFTTAGGMPANYIAKWNGSSWSALGSGMNDQVNAFTAYDDGGGPALYAGGDFLSALDSGDSYLAKWGGCFPPPSPWTNLGSGLAGITGIPQLNGTGELLAGTPGKLRLIDAAPSAPAALFISASNTPTPFKGGILLTVPVLLTLPLVTDSMGDLLLPWTAWPSGLSGVSLYFQYAIQDSAAVKGVALSNALGADVP